jgi:hypothetical protein
MRNPISTLGLSSGEFLKDADGDSLEIVLEQVILALESDNPLDREMLASQFPKHRSEVCQFIDNWLSMEQATAQLAVQVPLAGANSEDPLSGRQIGDYEILEVINRGGMGVVYRALQKRLGRVVAFKIVWDRHRDTVRFRIEAEAAASLHHPAWFMACCESSKANSPEGVIRIVTSKEVLPWESVALIHSPTPSKLLSKPRLSVTPDGQLMLTSVGIVPNPQSSEPLSEYGGTIQNMAWYASDGHTWSQTNPVGRMNFIHGKTVWQNKQAFSYSRGSICGNAQTITIALGEAGPPFKEIYKETVSGYFPSEASLTFVGDLGFCLMSRFDERNSVQTGLLGTSTAPFVNWKWKDTSSQLSRPNSIRLADNRVLVVVGMHDKRTRTSLCQLNLDTGMLIELLEIPSSGAPAHAGMGFHDGQLWISFRAGHQNTMSAHLAQISVE